MIYIVDACVLMTAHNTYLAIDQVPEYWEWLSFQGSSGNVKIPYEILGEITDGRDDDLLRKWIEDEANERCLLLDAEIEQSLVERVTIEGYAADLTDTELATIGRDSILIAYGLADPNCCVVTTEPSAPKKQRQNRRVPDVCQTFGIQCCDPIVMNRKLGFKTSWRPPK